MVTLFDRFAFSYFVVFDGVLILCFDADAL